MKPKPFLPKLLPGYDNFVRNTDTGLVYHRVFNRVLYADTDRSGVVYHANYLRYFELGRCSLMRDMGYPYAEVEKAGYVYPVVDLGIRFVKPLFYDSPMWVYTRIAEMARVRVRFEYVITCGDKQDQVCAGHTLHCALDHQNRPTAVDPITIQCFDKLPR